VPAPVPPGFTRGPILFMGPLLDAHVTDRLLQSFWDEAGSYGARIVIVPSAAIDTAAAADMQAWFTAAEADTVAILEIPNRRAAADPALLSQVENATGILITDGNPLRKAELLRLRCLGHIQELSANVSHECVGRRILGRGSSPGNRVSFLGQNAHAGAFERPHENPV